MRAVLLVLSVMASGAGAGNASKSEPFPLTSPPREETVCESARFGVELPDGGGWQFVMTPEGRWARCVGDAGFPSGGR